MAAPLRKILVPVLALLLIVVISGSFLWRRTRIEPRKEPEPAQIAAQPAPPRPAARDFHLDRETTTSAEAFKLYAEGVGLEGRLPVQAATRFRKALMLDAEFAPAHYRLALASVALSRRDEAATEVAAAIRQKDRLPEPYRTIAPILSLYVAGSFDLAAAGLAEALEHHPGEPDLQYMAGAICAHSCDHFDPNGAVEHFERTVEADPDHAAAREGLLVASGMKGMNDYSLTRAMEYQSRDSRRIDAVAEVGRVRTARGEYGDAIEAADEVVRRGEDPYAYGLAPAFILAGHHQQIESMYDSELERTNTAGVNAMTHLHAGINDIWLGKLGKAIEHFERGAEFTPGAWERSSKALFYLLVGRTHAVTGRSKEADAAFEAAEQVVGPRPILEYCLGLNKLTSGNRQDADRAVHRLSQETRISQPGWNEPWRLLLSGEIALATGQTARAVDEFRQAWQLEKPLDTDCIAGYVDAYFLDALGRAYLTAGKAPDALAAFEQIRALGLKALHQPEISVLALFHSGVALDMMGRQRDAREQYRLFVQAWGGADNPPPQVGEAKGKL